MRPRYMLIHGYDLINHSLVWEVIQRDVPVQLAEVAALLGAHEGPVDGQPYAWVEQVSARQLQPSPLLIGKSHNLCVQ